MDIMSIAKLLVPLAPVAGSIIGGLIPFPGASMMGQALGTALAKQFGVPPDQLAGSVAAAPSDVTIAKVNAAMEECRANVQGFVDLERAAQETIQKTVLATNQTMQMELGHESPYYTGWRPFIGWVFGGVALAYGLMLVVAMAVVVARSQTPIKELSDAWPLFVGYFGVLGLVVGVYIPSRSAEKTAALNAGLPLRPPAPPEAPKLGPPKPPVQPSRAGGQ